MSTDPFAGGDSNPSLSFKDKPFGTTYKGTVVELPSLMQGRDFETGEPATWPDGNPKMVVCVTLDIGGEKWNLWAAKPSSMFSAIKDAQQRAGVQIAVGGTLTVTYTHDEPNKTNPKLNPAKQYEAEYAPPNVFEEPVAPTIAPERRTDEELATPPVAAPVAAAPAAAPAANPAETAKQLIAAGLPIEQVAEATGLPSTTVAALANLVASGA
jgi:hypothetical protein